MTNTYQIIEGEITATDLKAEIANMTSEHPGIEIETANVIVGDSAERAQVIFIPAFGRAGIAWGADAEWTDASSLQQAVTLWENGEMVN